MSASLRVPAARRTSRHVPGAGVRRMRLTPRRDGPRKLLRRPVLREHVSRFVPTSPHDGSVRRRPCRLALQRSASERRFGAVVWHRCSGRRRSATGQCRRRWICLVAAVRWSRVLGPSRRSVGGRESEMQTLRYCPRGSSRGRVSCMQRTPRQYSRGWGRSGAMTAESCERVRAPKTGSRRVRGENSSSSERRQGFAARPDLGATTHQAFPEHMTCVAALSRKSGIN